mgnify:FL=1
MKKKVFVVALTGPNAAGKGLVATFFIKKNFNYFSLSDIVREEALKNGLTTSREHLIITGRKLREEFGLSVLAERTLKKIEEKSVVDSFRHPSEVNFFRNNCALFYLLGVDAPQRLRYERAKKRERVGDSISSYEEFIKKEEEENSKGSGQQLKATLALADEIIINDGKREDLHKILEPIYNKLERIWQDLRGGLDE